MNSPMRTVANQVITVAKPMFPPAPGRRECRIIRLGLRRPGFGGAVAAEDSACGVQELLAHGWRGQDLHLCAEAREAVRGGQLVLERKRHLLPALLVGREGGAHGFPDRVAE